MLVGFYLSYVYVYAFSLEVTRENDKLSGEIMDFIQSLPKYSNEYDKNNDNK